MRAFAHGVLREASNDGGGWQDGSARGGKLSPVRSVRIDLNRASFGELLAVRGLGPVRAEAVILHRVRCGWFHSVDELAAVEGVGAGVVAQVRPFVFVAPIVIAPASDIQR
ncbi:hypothetical protein LBMAG49_23660 [Planctomycetota bacterium]|nr:helix-hairpin-helix domain-containing protein [Planctomycetota bacterium]GDY03037.1 hypothetical protein LBMAG49_23660 [Planctomycetota bacterium]